MVSAQDQPSNGQHYLRGLQAKSLSDFLSRRVADREDPPRREEAAKGRSRACGGGLRLLLIADSVSYFLFQFLFGFGSVERGCTG